MRPVKNKAQIIAASQVLRQRAVNYTTGFDLKINEEVRALIETAITATKDEFSNEILGKLREMRRLVKEAETDEFQRIFIMTGISDLAFDIKGLGGTFGYPLLSRLAKSLHDFIGKIGLPNEIQFAVISLHIDAMYLVLAQGKSGPGGSLEQQVVDTLAVAVNKTMFG